MPILVALLLFLMAGICNAQPLIQVKHGWGGVDRAGRWNPVTVRVSDAVPRNVAIELIGATEGGFARVVRENAAIGPTPGTFEIFAPTEYSQWGQSVVVLRDSQTGRVIGQFPAHIRQAAPKPAALGPQNLFVGISGRQAPLEQLLRYAGAQSAFMPRQLVPRSAIGFDCLEVLFLNQPDLRELDLAQQRAIMAWVRSGGSLLLVPGDGPPPPGSPLIRALPCRIGPVTQFTLAPEVWAGSGLGARYASLPGHVLAPLAGARPLTLIKGSQIIAWSGRLGLGRIVVAPIDLAGLEFDASQEAASAPAFWKPILNALVKLPVPQNHQQFAAPYAGYQSESEDQQREGAAMNTLADFIAPSRVWGGLVLPGGMIVVLCLLFVIGPLDWMVVRLTGSLTWRWTAFGGCIGLIALCCLWGFSLFNRGRPALASVRVIEQADDACVAESDLVAVQSAAPARLQIVPGAAGSWWQPVLPAPVVAQTALQAQPDMLFHEADTGCLPGPLWVRGRQRRLLRSVSHAAAPAVIHAVLRLANNGNTGPWRLTGTIKNLSALPLKDIRIRTRFGVVKLPIAGSGALEPAQQIRIDLLAKGEPFSPQALEGRYQSYGAFGSRSYNTPLREEDLWVVAPDLAGRRSLRIDGLIEGSGDAACIYAQFISPPPQFRAAGKPATNGNAYQWLRALIPLN